MIQKGTVVFTSLLSGTSSNVLTLGRAGQGSTALLTTAASGTFAAIGNSIIVASGTGGILTLGGIAPGGQQRFSGAITLNGDINARSLSPNGTINNGVYFLNTISGGGSLTKTGTGNLVLSGANTFTGDTILAPGNGELQLNNQNALQNSTLNYTGSTLTFRLDTTTAFTFGGLTGSANIVLQVNSQAIALSVGKNNSSPAAYTGILSGTRSLTKVGNGTLTLGGANSYTGTTTINAGTLNAGVANALGGTSSMTVNAGGTLLLSNSGTNDRIKDTASMALNGGTFNTGGLSEHGATNNTAGLGTLTLQSSSIIDMGSSSSIIAFADSLALAANWSGTLSIYNWSGNPLTGGGTDQLFVGNTNLGLAGSQLLDFQFYSGAGTGAFAPGAIILNTGEVVPTLVTAVPEPSTWVAGALALPVISYRQQRRFQRKLIVAS